MPDAPTRTDDEAAILAAIVRRTDDLVSLVRLDWTGRKGELSDVRLCTTAGVAFEDGR